MKVAALVPVKLASRRLPNKNFLLLGNKPLASYIFETLRGVSIIDSVYCYTSQSQVLSLLPEGVKLLPRPIRLDSDSIKANELFAFAVEKLHDYDVIAICHPTGPFVSADSLCAAISCVMDGSYNCAFSVRKHSTYAWFRDKPLNYNPLNMAQTQGLDSIYLETSGFYVFRREDYLRTGSRINGKSKMIEISIKESVDIDNPEDFAYARHMLDYTEEMNGDDYDGFFVDVLNRNIKHGTIKHISFDLDGVLVDTLPVMKDAWSLVCAKYALDIPFSRYQDHIGIPFFDIMHQLGVEKKLWQDIILDYVESCRLNDSKMTIFNGILDMMKVLHGSDISLSIVTSKPRERAVDVIKRVLPSGSDCLLVTPEDVPSGRGKPCPDPLLFACCQLGQDPSDTVYVGDMSVDRLAAKRAGAHFVHACWGYQKLPALTDVWFASVPELTSYLLEVMAASS
jgi:CMP-N-acetylneuraminic acid synthetase/phosphoglycolate phosphatase-like HAD superfamily hydrolase